MSRSSLAAVVAVAPSSAAAFPRPVLAAPVPAAPMPLPSWASFDVGVDAGQVVSASQAVPARDSRSGRAPGSGTRPGGGVTMRAEQLHVATGQKAVPLTAAGRPARPRERDAADLGRAGVDSKL